MGEKLSHCFYISLITNNVEAHFIYLLILFEFLFYELAHFVFLLCVYAYVCFHFLKTFSPSFLHSFFPLFLPSLPSLPLSFPPFLPLFLSSFHLLSLFGPWQLALSLTSTRAGLDSGSTGGWGQRNYSGAGMALEPGSICAGLEPVAVGTSLVLRQTGILGL